MPCCGGKTPLEKEVIAGLQPSTPTKKIYKIVVCGQMSVGKSSLIDRLVGFKFNPHITATIGVEFKQIIRKHGSTDFKFHIWDTAGQEKYRSVTDSYFRGISVVIFVFDLMNKKSFNELLEYWIPKVDGYAKETDKPVLRVLIGNKKDLRQPDKKYAVGKKEIHGLSKLEGWKYWKTSAKEQTQEYLVSIFEEVITWTMMNDPSVDASILSLPGQLPEVLDEFKSSSESTSEMVPENQRSFEIKE